MTSKTLGKDLPNDHGVQVDRSTKSQPAESHWCDVSGQGFFQVTWACASLWRKFERVWQISMNGAKKPGPERVKEKKGA